MSSKQGSYIGISFSVKLALWFGLFFLITVTSLFYFTLHLFEQAMNQKDDELVTVQINKYKDLYYRHDDSLQQEFLKESKLPNELIFIRIVNPISTVELVSNSQHNSNDYKEEMEAIPIDLNDSWKTVDGKNRWIVKSLKLSNRSTLQFGKKTPQSIIFINSLRQIFINNAIPILLLGIFVGIILTYRAIKPIRNIVKTVHKILQTGEMRGRVESKKHAKGALRELVSIINRMLNRNEEIFDAMRNSLDNVAHDLRTPMTRLRGSAETALLSDDNDNLRDALGDCLEESDNVLQMLNTMMDVAEIESGAIKLNKSSVNLNLLLSKIIELYEIVAEDQSIRVLKDFSSQITIQADVTRLKQVFANLLDNAIKYSHQNSTIWVIIKDKGNWAEVSIQDQGIGIAEEEKIRIFNRLYRSDSSRSKHGLGLGLSLVKGIVEAHHGTINVDSDGSEKGSIFTVKLPK